MRGFLFGLFVVIACGGETTQIDGGTEAAPQQCWVDPRVQSDRTCTLTSECAVVDYTADCCGSVVVHGVRADRANAVHEAEVANNNGCAVCKCLAKQTVDDLGSSGNAYLASCDNGVCTSHAQ